MRDLRLLLRVPRARAGEIVAELEQYGFTPGRLSRMLGRSENWLARMIRLGNDPPWSAYEALRLLLERLRAAKQAASLARSSGWTSSKPKHYQRRLKKSCA
jgi:hypothetical protein